MSLQKTLCGRSYVTVQQHILEGQKRFPGASGDFSSLLSGITLASKIIADKVRRAGISDILGAQGDINVQGEVQQKLDVYANEMLYHYMGLRDSVGVLASEENENPTILHQGADDAKYAIVFDPLDGSSNIDVNVSVGTTFSILRCPEDDEDLPPEEWVLQPGRKQIAAGYVVYGSSTILVYSVGNGVHGFTLDPSIGVFVLSHPNMRMPAQGHTTRLMSPIVIYFLPATLSTLIVSEEVSLASVIHRATSAPWLRISIEPFSRVVCSLPANG